MLSMQLANRVLWYGPDTNDVKPVLMCVCVCVRERERERERVRESEYWQH